MNNTNEGIQLKEILHLYLGCECSMTKPSYHAVHELHLSADRPFSLTGKLLHYFIEPTTKAECKPHLRPLADMTEDEEEAIGINKSYYINGPGKEAFEFHPNDIVYLLSIGIDFFGLIESKQAIDKSKLPK